MMYVNILCFRTGQHSVRMNSTNDSLPSPAASSFPVPLSVTLFSLGTIVTVENCIVMIACIRNLKLRKNIHHNLVLALSIGDLFLGVGAICTGFRLTVPILSGVLPLCIGNVFLQVTGVAMSHFQTFYISFNRFLVITESRLNTMMFDGYRKYIVYAISWATVMSFNASIMAPLVSSKKQVCNVKTAYGNNYDIFRPTFLSFNAVLLTLTIVFYVLTLWGIRHRYRKTAPKATMVAESSQDQSSSSYTTSSGGQIEKIKARRFLNSMKLVSIIIIALMVFSGPIVFINLSQERSHIVIIMTLCAATVNSLINPIIYGLQIEDLKNEIKKMFKCK